MSNLNEQQQELIEDTQMDTLAVPDTMVNIDTQANDTSWLRDIERLMRKLEQPSSSRKLHTQTQQTEIEDETVDAMFVGQTRQQATTKTQTNQKKQIQSTTIIQRNEIGIQTEMNSNSLSMHHCCHDISVCPCVLVS